MDEAMNRLWRGLDFRRPSEFMDSWAVALDIVDRDKEIVVKASLPDVDPDKVEVSVEEGVLTIKGSTESEREEKKEDYVLRERRAGSFYRTVRLPDAVDASKAKSTYAKGVLTVAFPKAAAKKAQKIKVETTE
jgi:HSP20 family protein